MRLLILLFSILGFSLQLNAHEIDYSSRMKLTLGTCATIGLSTKKLFAATTGLQLLVYPS